MRILNKCKCTECGYTSYDNEFENWEFTTVEENENGISHTVDIKNICPECGAKDKIEYYE